MKPPRQRSPDRSSSNNRPAGITVCVVTDGFSTWVDDVLDAIHRELDESTGDVVHVVKMGDPRRAGPNYRRLRSPEMAKRDQAEEAAYQKRSKAAGGDDYLIRELNDELAKEFGVSCRPALIIAFSPIDKVVVRIPRALGDTAELRRRFGEILVEELRADKIRPLAPKADFSNPIARQRVATHAQSLERMLAALVSASEEDVDPARGACEVSAPVVVAIAFTQTGRRELAEQDYRSLRESAKTLDVFADERTREVWKHGQQVTPPPRATWFRLLRAAVTSRRRFDPEDSEFYEDLGDPRQAFQRARAGIDLKTAAGGWTLFKTEMILGNAKYRYAPDSDAKFALVFLP